MPSKNRSVPVDTVLPHVSYQNLGEAMAWLTEAFGFKEYYRYGDGPSGGQMWAGKAAIQVRQAGSGQKSPAQLGYGTQSLTVFVDDVDQHHARAKAAGARIVEEPHETEYGEYQYAAEDLEWTPLAVLAAREGSQPRGLGCNGEAVAARDMTWSIEIRYVSSTLAKYPVCAH